MSHFFISLFATSTYFWTNPLDPANRELDVYNLRFHCSANSGNSDNTALLECYSLVTEELIRKRCEHNEGEIGTLEELSLHQENIERIEHLQNWCRDLKILLFHSNLIGKIENLHKMKKLQYLNLSLNIIERIENLEGCESLEKLDLTLNFVGELTSVYNLKQNTNLTCLYLTGNPCTDYTGYRQYVVATLPQLTCLDGTDIARSERIQALQNYENVTKIILLKQEEYKKKRLLQKSQNELMYKQKRMEMQDDDFEDEEKMKRFWNEPSDNSPETRLFIAEQSSRRENKCKIETIKQKRVYRFFNNDGNPLNVNEAQVPFTLVENDDSSGFILTVNVYKYLDTALLEADIQPTYIRVNIKGKALQLVLSEEVNVDSSVAQRSQTTGQLIVKMPKVKSVIKPQVKMPEKKIQDNITKLNPYSSKRELLEIGSNHTSIILNKYVDNDGKLKMPKPRYISIPEKIPSSEFEEDISVPPLE